MSTLYIIGAGCSRNYSQSTSKVPGLACPLNNDFFKMAKKVVASLNIREGADWVFDGSIGHLIPDLCEMYGYSRDTGINVFDDPRLELEDVITMFSLRTEIFGRPHFTYGYPHDMIRTIDRTRLPTLLELVSRTLTEALSGPPCEKHKKLAESMSPGDIVFSYNYDLLMDNALRDTGKLGESGYLLSFYRTLKDGAWTKPVESASKIKMIKLHGSLNWARCIICGSNLLIHHQKVGSWNSFTSRFKCPKCHGGGDTSSQMIRLLVPPLLTKSYDDRDINYLWFEAARLLKNVDEIVVIGYSLPKADAASKTLLLTSRRNMDKIPLTIVDPNPDVKSRFETIFNNSRICEFKNLDYYLKTL